MEIKYSKFSLDTKTYGNFELCGIIDRNSNFIDKRVYDIKMLKYNPNITVGMFLFINKIKHRELVDTLLESFGFTKVIKKKLMRNLSNSELIKILLVKVCSSEAKVIILEHIDTYLNYRDLKDVLVSIRKQLKTIEAHVLFSTNKIDNAIEVCDRFIIASENRIIYDGKDIDKLPEKTSIASFVDGANSKGAKLSYYKEPNDLLKAIYRSVKK